jgi:hypothetical protein
MAKRSTNFTGKKPIKGSHVLSLMQWVGMTDAEIKAALEKKRARPLPMNGTDAHQFGEE